MMDIEQFIRDLNETWREHRYQDLRQYFADDVVMLQPGGHAVLKGVDAMIDSYRQFGEVGTIHAFDITELSVYNYSSFVMCHMGFTVDYEIQAGRFVENGLEIYTIDNSGPEPRIVWRTQITFNSHA